MRVDPFGHEVERADSAAKGCPRFDGEKSEVRAEFVDDSGQGAAWNLASLGDVERKRRFELPPIPCGCQIRRPHDDSRVVFPDQDYDFRVEQAVAGGDGQDVPSEVSPIGLCSPVYQDGDSGGLAQAEFFFEDCCCGTNLVAFARHCGESQEPTEAIVGEKL
nr:hypothetical protein [Rhodococcus sp. 06-418-1B]